jgi:hypothetical protein
MTSSYFKKNSGIFFKILAVAGIVFSAGVIVQKSDSELAQKIRRRVLGEEIVSQNQAGIRDNSLKSENYRIDQLNLGGNEFLNLNSEDASLPLVVSEVKSEIYNIKDKNETKMMLSWRTNKESLSIISYSKKGQETSKTVKEANFELEHSIVLSNLDADSVYSYKIRSLDRWGMEKISDEYVFYTGAANVSFIDILSEAAGKLFGWAMKK